MQVDWALVTALATVLGVIGGLISVGFVVYEIRRNSLAIEGSTVQNLMAYESQVFQVILANADVYSRGFAARDTLAPSEILQFNTMVGIIMSYCYSAFVQHQKGLIDDEVWQTYMDAASARLDNPSFRASWHLTEFSYPLGFKKVISDILASKAM